MNASHPSVHYHSPEGRSVLITGGASGIRGNCIVAGCTGANFLIDAGLTQN